MKVVIDTNVLVSALRGRGSSSFVVDACIGGELIPVLSDALFFEYRDVFARSGLFRMSSLSDRERDIVFKAFLSVCERTDVYFRWRSNLRDEADNHILELAVAGNARMIVTFNTRDFARQEIRFPDIGVAKPHELRRSFLS